MKLSFSGEEQRPPRGAAAPPGPEEPGELLNSLGRGFPLDQDSLDQDRPDQDRFGQDSLGQDSLDQSRLDQDRPDRAVHH